MGLADRLKDLRRTAQETAVEHEDEIKVALQKAEATVEERTGGKYHDQVQKATTKADAFIEGLKQPQGQAGSNGAKPEQQPTREPG